MHSLRGWTVFRPWMDDMFELPHWYSLPLSFPLSFASLPSLFPSLFRPFYVACTGAECSNGLVVIANEEFIDFTTVAPPGQPPHQHPSARAAVDAALETLQLFQRSAILNGVVDGATAFTATGAIAFSPADPEGLCRDLRAKALQSHSGAFRVPTGERLSAADMYGITDNTRLVPCHFTDSCQSRCNVLYCAPGHVG